MYCYKCGKQVDDEVAFCPHCGAQAKGTEAASSAPSEPATAPVYNAAPAQPVEDKPPRVWSIFALIGKILGIVCLCASVIPYLNYFSFGFSIVGIVLSCLGRKAKNEAADKNSSLGLKLSIAALVISFVLMIVYTVVFVVVLGNAAGGFYYDYYY